MFRSYVQLSEDKSPFSHGFPVFLRFSYGFLMVFVSLPEDTFSVDESGASMAGESSTPMLDDSTRRAVSPSKSMASEIKIHVLKKRWRISLKDPLVYVYLCSLITL